MCGRYARNRDKQKIAEALHVKEVPNFAIRDTFQKTYRQLSTKL